MRGLLYTFFAVGTCVSAMTPSHGDRLSVPEPTQHELQKRRGGGSHGGGGGGGGGYYGPDYAAVTTCGLIPYAIGKGSISARLCLLILLQRSSEVSGVQITQLR